MIVPAVAVKVAVVAPAATVSEAGTVSTPLLLERETAAPPVGATFDSVTVQLDVPPLKTLVGAHETELTTTGATSDSVAVFEVPLYVPVMIAL